MVNEGFDWDSLLKMVHNPGGDWHPGWGVDLNYNYFEAKKTKHANLPVGSLTQPMDLEKKV